MSASQTQDESRPSFRILPSRSDILHFYSPGLPDQGTKWIASFDFYPVVTRLPIMKTHWLLLVLLSMCGICHADRDIVYSARYYAPPGSHRTSHFHIYRINPDGTGKTQLTFGSADEEMPIWTPDGRHITFLENTQTPKPLLLCEVDGNGARRRVLKTVTDNSWMKPAIVPGYRLENDETDNDSATDKHILIDLKTLSRLTLAIPAHDDLYDVILPMPGHDLVYAANDHNSTVGTDYLFYRLHPETGALKYLTEGQFLTWSPDGSQFCVVPGRDTTPYEKRKEAYPVQYFGHTDAQYRTVWYAPLYVRTASGGKMRQLTPRLSYVTGADWRKIK